MAVESTFWIDVAKTLIGTFVGAALAFGANIYVQRLLRRREERQAGNAAAMILAMQWHDFVNFRLGFLDGLSEPKQLFGEFPHWVLARPNGYTFSESLDQDVSKLVFLGDHGGAEALQKIVVAERRYLDLVRLAKRYNEAATERQARFEKIWAQGPFDVAELLRDTSDSKNRLKRLEQTIGLELVGRLDATIDSLLERFAADETDYSNACDSLQKNMRRVFRKKVFGVERLTIGQGDAERATAYIAERYRPVSIQLER